MSHGQPSHRTALSGHSENDSGTTAGLSFPFGSILLLLPRAGTWRSRARTMSPINAPAGVAAQPHPYLPIGQSYRSWHLRAWAGRPSTRLFSTKRSRPHGRHTLLRHALRAVTSVHHPAGPRECLTACSPACCHHWRRKALKAPSLQPQSMGQGGLPQQGAARPPRVLPRQPASRSAGQEKDLVGTHVIIKLSNPNNRTAFKTIEIADSLGGSEDHCEDGRPVRSYGTTLKGVDPPPKSPRRTPACGARVGPNARS